MPFLNQTHQELITARLANGYEPSITVTYRGKTTTAVATQEIFLDGQDGQRLQLPLSSTAYITKVALGWNSTDGVAATNTPEVSTTTALRSTANAQTSTEAAAHVATDITSVDTAGTKYLTVVVNPADALDVIFWEVSLTIFCTKFPVEGSYVNNVYDGKQK